ncbi:GNAT family N-acetyltransferase [Bacillus sp. B190/17]|uniref:Lipid II:glycine glycyltransferase n=1 Tax=Bacillus lumedeiriae TaxID=3058829 RepID=A0ABW8ICL8_9BACI
MIVSPEEALRVFNKLPNKLQSFYFHPQYVIDDALSKQDLQPIFFTFERSDAIYYHAFHLGKVPNTHYYDIQSPYGYGGPLYVGKEDFIIEAIEKYKQWCLDHNVLVEFVRFHPLLKNENQYYGQVYKNRQTVYIDLKTEELFSEFSTRVRTAIRKAEKSNVNIVFSKSQAYIDQFIQMYTSLMDKKNAGKDYFFHQKYFSELLKHENVYLLSAVNDNSQVIGSSIFFTYGQIAEYHLSTSNDEGRKKNVANLLLYEFAKYAQKRKYRVLYLGGGTNSSDENSLLFFKRGFSKNEAPFYIGSFKHNEKVYGELRTEYIAREPKKESYILFYR